MNTSPVHSHRARLVAAVAALSAVAAACTAGGSKGSGGGHSSGSAGDTITIADPQAPVNLNPVLGIPGGYNEFYYELAYEPLIRLGADGVSLKPALATSWKFLDSSNKKFQLMLRSDAKFSDGTPVTAQAVETYLKYYQANATDKTWLAGAQYATPSATELDITLASPRPDLPTAMSDNFDQVGWVISPQALQNPSVLGSTTDGAGPYMLDKSATVAGSKYVYVPNPNYYDKSALHWKKFIVDVLSTPSSALAALQSGQVQVISGIPQEVGAAKSAGLQVIAEPSSPFMINFGDLRGTMVPALAKKQVREALARAVDREGIVKAVFNGYASTSQQVLSPGLPGYDPALENAYPFDLGQAKQLLAQAGYPNGFDAGTLLVGPESGMKEMMEVVAEDWSKIGVKVKLLAPDPKTWVPDLQTKQWAIWSIGGYFSDLTFTLDDFFSPDAAASGHYPFPTLAGPKAQAQAAPFGSAASLRAYQAMNDSLTNDVLGIFGVNPDWIYFASQKIGGISIHAPRIASVLDWYAK